MANKGPSSQGYGFASGHIWMWQLDYKERWVQKNWCFELWCRRRLLRVPWTARRSNQSILMDISTGCSLDGLMLKLNLQYFGHTDGKILMRRADSFEKTLMLGKIEGKRRRGRQRMRWLDGIPGSMDTSWLNSGSWWWAGRPDVLRSIGSQKIGHDWVTDLNWIASSAVLVFLVQQYRSFIITYICISPLPLAPPALLSSHLSRLS